MKRVFGYILSITMIVGMLIMPMNAQEVIPISENGSVVIRYDDGSYLTVITSEVASAGNSRASATTKNQYKTFTYCNSSDEIEWVYTLYATFSYVYGSSVTCTASSYDYTIYKDSWKFSDGSTSHSGATAYGYGTFKNKVLFVTTKTINVEAEITCDVYGNIS